MVACNPGVSFSDWKLFYSNAKTLCDTPIWDVQTHQNSKRLIDYFVKPVSFESIDEQQALEEAEDYFKEFKASGMLLEPDCEELTEDGF